MSATHNLFGTLQTFELGNGSSGKFYSLPALEKAGIGPVSKLPVSIRLVLESVLRNCDGKRVSEQNVRALANWKPREQRAEEIPFVVARIVLQDFTGVPLLVDLAAMRSAVARLGKNPKIIEPLGPGDLVADHSVQVGFAGTAQALKRNPEMVYFLTPDVVGVYLTGSLREGVTATDLALTLTQALRQAKVVGKFVEFYGPGAAALPVVDRATIANMAPEYGATMGFFPIDTESVNYLRATGRTEEQCRTYENYYRAQNLFGIPKKGEIAYSQELDLDLGTVVPSVAGPKRPQDRIDLPNLKHEFVTGFSRPISENGFGKAAGDLSKSFHVSHYARPRAVGVGSQEPVSQQAAKARNTNPTTELEMANNRPTPHTTNVPT